MIEDQKNYTDEKSKIVVAIGLGNKFSELRKILGDIFTLYDTDNEDETIDLLNNSLL